MNINYSIVSIGTEKAGSDGYISITEIGPKGKRYICSVPHFTSSIDENMNMDFLKVDGNIQIWQVSLARFQLIPYLCFLRNNIYNYKKICVVGGGSIGIASYLELQRYGIKDILLKTRRIDYCKYLSKNGLNAITQDDFDYKNFDCIVECTGNGMLLRDIIAGVKYKTAIYLIGTPRTNILIDPLIIHRKNIKLIGGHELNGIDNMSRQKAFDDILIWHKFYSKNKYRNLVRFHSASIKELTRIKAHQYMEPIHILQY